MKKLVVMICVLVMMLSMASTVYAATVPAAAPVTVAQVKQDLYTAKPADIASNVTMQIPANFTVTTKGDVTTLTDGTHTIEVIAQDASKSEYPSLADAKKAFIDAGLQKSVVEMNINGVPALGVVTADGTYMVLIQTPDGRMITLKYPDFNTADAEYKAWIENMIKSIVVK